MVAIVNVDKNWGIGCDGDQPFYIAEDLQFFKEKTLGTVVVMGSNTLKALPKSTPLPKRRNIVLTRQLGTEIQGAEVCNSVEELIEVTVGLPDDTIFVIGGAEIYKLLLPYCHKAYVTKIYAEADRCDKWFPNLDGAPDWHLSSSSEVKESNGLKFQFCEYIKGE